MGSGGPSHSFSFLAILALGKTPSTIWLSPMRLRSSCFSLQSTKISINAAAISSWMSRLKRRLIHSHHFQAELGTMFSIDCLCVYTGRPENPLSCLLLQGDWAGAQLCHDILAQALSDMSVPPVVIYVCAWVNHLLPDQKGSADCTFRSTLSARVKHNDGNILKAVKHSERDHISVFVRAFLTFLYLKCSIYRKFTSTRCNS